LNKSWRKVRVVVELSVQGNYTAKDLSRELNRFLNARDFFDLHEAFPRLQDLNCGPFRAASFNRIEAASRIKNPAHKQFVEVRKLLTELSTRISQLESNYSNPTPPRFDRAAQVRTLGADSLLPKFNRLAALGFNLPPTPKKQRKSR
jgi:hypothetical protein